MKEEIDSFCFLFFYGEGRKERKGKKGGREGGSEPRSNDQGTHADDFGTGIILERELAGRGGVLPIFEHGQRRLRLVGLQVVRLLTDGLVRQAKGIVDVLGLVSLYHAALL